MSILANSMPKGMTGITEFSVLIAPLWLTL